ncbi:hypothetical protein B0T14DRAFT_565130 [Immersiella caudata]|uniref:Uncharacterized protein n=1 Tax=Immersiella caudata TaxID=314043 RepID=A0AA39WY74_9PEZI|nr:hypothetical protein B0T14DRAFT_565130 [Immersiella caudata]
MGRTKPTTHHSPSPKAWRFRLNDHAKPSTISAPAPAPGPSTKTRSRTTFPPSTVFTIPSPPHPSGIQPIPLTTKTLTTSLDAVPFHWTCCLCNTTQRLTNPNSFRLTTPTLESKTFPFPPASSPGSSEKCALCTRKMCYHCSLLSVYGNEIRTLGGKNFLADRLIPAVWKCCGCKGTRFAVGMYRVGAHVFMQSLNEGEGGCIAFHCKYGKRQDSPGDHEVCAECEVVNRYGEVLGFMDPNRFLEDKVNKSSPPKENLVWSVTWYTRLMKETPCEGPMRELVDVGKAGHDLELARDCIDKAVAWVKELKEAVEARNQYLKKREAK